MGKDDTEWEDNIADAIKIAFKAVQTIGAVDKEYQLIVFELVLRKMLDLKFQSRRFP